MLWHLHIVFTNVSEIYWLSKKTHLCCICLHAPKKLGNRLLSAVTWFLKRHVNEKHGFLNWDNWETQ